MYDYANEKYETVRLTSIYQLCDDLKEVVEMHHQECDSLKGWTLSVQDGKPYVICRTCLEAHDLRTWVDLKYEKYDSKLGMRPPKHSNGY